jgi:hypothetical protein
MRLAANVTCQIQTDLLEGISSRINASTTTTVGEEHTSLAGLEWHEGLA